MKKLNEYKKILLLEIGTLSQLSKRYFFVSVFTSLISAFLDLSIANAVSEGFSELGVNFFVLLATRMFVGLISTFFIIKFCTSVEIDKKRDVVYLSSEASREQAFTTVSLNISHHSYTGVLRVLTESLVLILILIYVGINFPIFFIWALLGLMFSMPLISLLLKMTRTLRNNASREQLAFLSKGLQLVRISDRLKSLGAERFFFDWMTRESVAYRIATNRSLFAGQATKPIFEFSAFTIGLISLRFFELSAGLVYLCYRLVTGLNIILGLLPIIMHYIAQYRAVYSRE